MIGMKKKTIKLVWEVGEEGSFIKMKFLFFKALNFLGIILMLGGGGGR